MNIFPEKIKNFYPNRKILRSAGSIQSKRVRNTPEIVRTETVIKTSKKLIDYED